MRLYPLILMVLLPLAAAAAPNDPPAPKGLPKTQHDLVRRTYQVLLGKPVGFAYLASTVGVVAVDIANLGKPSYVGVARLPGSVNDLTWVHGKLVAALGPNGVVAIDVHDPSKPKRVGAIKLAGAAMGVAGHSTLALVASGTAGLHVVDLANPARPRRALHVETPGYARAVTIDGDRVFLADGTGGVRIYRLAQRPLALTHIRTIKTKGHVFDLDVEGSALIVAEGHVGVSLHNVANLRKPKLVARRAVQDTARGVAAGGGRAVVADGTKGVMVVDTTGRLKEIGRYKPDRSVNNVSLAGKLAFVANDYDGLLILRLSPKPGGVPVFVGSLPPRKK